VDGARSAYRQSFQITSPSHIYTVSSDSLKASVSMFLPFRFLMLVCIHLWCRQSNAWPASQTVRTVVSLFEMAEGTYQRKTRNNKYENFSKLIRDNLDPMDRLLKESAHKLQALQDEKERKIQARKPQRKKQTPEAAVVPPILFPDTENIDPYDPTTFGYVEIATVGGSHGVHGWIKVKCTTDFAVERLCTPGVRHLKATNKRAPRQVYLLNGKHRQGDDYLIQLEGIEDRDAALKLRGSTLYAREEEKVRSDEPEEYIVSDLIGLDVFLDDEMEAGERRFVGKVGGIVFAAEICSIPGLGHDMLEIILPRGRGGMPSFRDEMVLVPMVSQIVTRIDLASASIYVDPPSGLLDLTYVREEKARTKAYLPPARD
jgi:16S rRNA processing protein RimM